MLLPSFNNGKKEFLKRNKYPNISGEDYALWLQTYRNNIFNNYQEDLYNYRSILNKSPKQVLIIYIFKNLKK